MSRRILSTLAILLILLMIPLGAYLQVTASQSQREHPGRTQQGPKEVKNMNAEKVAEFVERVTRKIEQANLIGAKPEQVIAFLEREKIEHSPYDTGFPTNVSKKLGKIYRYIVALIRNVDQVPTSEAIWPVHLQLVFSFDKEDKLVDYSVEKTGDVPMPR